ncbi:MAG TPA: DUF5801 repeats-in-toxin domain-containing protein [Sphingomicrobium sp.]|nr:DUF5801 repeats-in-toxin domain-containing protein [Sphingomicrobium sp.]
MRYDDASSVSNQAAGAPDARDDADALAAGSSGPATGNTITGAGTITGAAGADLVANGPGQVVALEGAGGSDSGEGGSLQVGGRFGDLTMNSSGSYSYEPNEDAPNGGRDVFRYTIADSAGARDTATLTIDIGRELEEIKADAQQIIPGPDGVVTLPPGVQLSDILVVGRNLVINLPDGSQMVIVDGAVFVPQLVLGGVEVPATNLAALLIDAEPKPASGTPDSSGGNFAVDVPPLDPGVPLGDLIPPTELDYTPPIFEDVGQFIDEEPEIFVQPDGQPASVAAVDSVDEAGLPARDGNLPDEPPGSNSAANSETTTGTILVNSPDDPSVVTINGVAVTGVGQVFEGAHGTLTITSISDSAIGYSYTLTDNTSGNATHDDFSVTVTDNDGDTATATLTINIIDDVPTARNDTDASVDGVATGNVITDAAPGDVGDTDINAADTVGADDATLTSVSGAGGSDSTFGEGVLTVNGTHGVLVIDAQGNYTYTVNPNAGGGGVDVFTYTLTDGDGDTSTATLTITNPDLFPETDPNPVVRTDDDAVPGADGNPGGVGDDIDAENLNGTLSGSGGDGALTFDLLTTGAPAGFTYVNGPDGSILVQQGGTTVLTITINAATGAYTVTQNAPIDHPAGGDENNLSFTINYTVTDADGDSAPGTLVINVDDDTPTIGREDVSAPTLTVDETDLTTDATGDFSGLFDVQYGADGAGTTSYAVTVVDGTDSGLVDVATGQSIFLFNDGGVVEGRVGGVGGVVAFTVSVNSVTGVVTLDQQRALDHPDATDPDDPVSPNATSIQLTVTATDGDGDPVDDTINIGANLVFEDDGPTANDDVGNQVGEDNPITVDVLANDEEGADGVSVDDVSYVGGTLSGAGILVYNGDGTFTYTPAPGEEGVVTFDYQILDGDSDPSVATVTINLQDDSEPQIGTPENLIVDEDGLAGANVDANPLQADPGETDSTESATDSGQVVVDFGDDVPDAPLVDSIELLDSPALDGQLVDLDGNPVTFALNGSGQLVGTANGTTVIIISITGAVAGPGAGEVTYSYSAQLLEPVQHADVGNNENTDLLSGVQFQVTDSDGDEATSSFSVTVVDDVPTATNDVDEIAGGGSTATGNVITGVGTNAGAANADQTGVDTPATITAISGFGGTDTTFSAGVLEIAGEFGTLEIDADGNYTYTRSDGAPGDAQDVFTYTLTDADGDSTTATLTINIGDAAPNLPDPALVRLDDDALTDGNPGGDGDDVDSAGLPGQLAGTGGDGDLDYNFTGVNTLPAGFSVNLVNAGTLQVLQGATVVLTITLDTDTGAFNVVQNNPIDHLAGDNENNYVFSIGVEVEDADGDVEPATITINVDDDTPVLEDVAAGGSVDLDETDAGTPAGFPISDTSVDPVIDATKLFGADGPAAVNSTVYSLSIVGGSPEPSGLQTAIGDFAITLVQIDANTIQGQYQDGGTQVAFTIDINTDGTVTLTQEVPLEHLDDGPPGPDHNDALDLDGLINATVTITDGDGDSTSASAPIGDNLVFLDDGPNAEVDGQVVVPTLTLDETRPVGEETDGDSDPAGLATVTVGFANNFQAVDYGADGPGVVSYDLVLAAEGSGSGLYALDNTDIDAGDGDGDGYGQGEEILLFTEADGSITGRLTVDGAVYFTISVNASGQVTFTQSLNVWHANAADSDDTSSLSAAAETLLLEQTVTDSDGDFDTATIDLSDGVFAIEDDGPQAIQPDAITEGLNNEIGASETADLDDDGEVITDFGTDGPGLVTFANITNGDDSGLTSDEDVIEYWLSDDGQTLEGRTNSTDGIDGELVFTVAINQGDGTYTVTMSGTIDNGAGVTFNNLTSSKAGNVDVRGVGADDPLTTVDLLLTASANGANATINTSSTTVGAANQSMNVGETIRIDFVTNLEDDPTDTLATFPSGFSYDGHVGTDSFLQLIPQVQGDQSQTVAFRVYALNTTVTDAGSPDDIPGDGFSDSTIVQITHVTVDGFDVGETSVTVAIGAIGVWTPIAYGVYAQLQADGSVIFTGIQEGDRYGIETGTDFNAVAVTSLATGIGPVGNLSTTDAFDLGVFSIGEVDSGEPIELSYDLNITDADGDTVTMVDAINITIDPAGTPAPLAATTMMVSQEPLGDTSSLSLMASDSTEQQRTMSAANNNSVLLGAIAAAGLGASSAAAANGFAARDYDGMLDSMVVGRTADEAMALDSGDSSRSALSGETQESVDDQPASESSATQSDVSAQHSLTDGGSEDAQAPSALSEGTEQSAPADTSFTSESIAMPSADMLAAANENGVDGAAKGTSEVGRVLADALAGGDGPSIDAILDAAANHGSPEALAALASHGAGAVSGWDTGGFGGFSGGQFTRTMDDMVLHPDAVQPAA